MEDFAAIGLRKIASWQIQVVKEIENNVDIDLDRRLFSLQRVELLSSCFHQTQFEQPVCAGIVKRDERQSGLVDDASGC